MEKLTLSDFEPLIKSLSRRTVINNIVDFEDIEQEMKIKLFKILPSFDAVSRDEVFRMAKVILKNHLIDIIRSYSCRPDSSHYSTLTGSSAEEEFDSLDGLIMDDVFDIYGTMSSCSRLATDEFAVVNCLVNEIKNWLEDKDDITKKFVNEAMDPSDEILVEWEEKKMKYQRFRGCDTIPGYTLSTMLGLSHKKYEKIWHSLKSHLIKGGFNIRA